MAQKLPVKRVIPATEVRNNLGTLLNRVYRSEEHLVVEKLGIPVAAIISMQDDEEYRRLLAQRRLMELGRKIGAEAKRKGLTEEQLQKELKQIRRKVFEETYSFPTS